MNEPNEPFASRVEIRIDPAPRVGAEVDHLHYIIKAEIGEYSDDMAEQWIEIQQNDSSKEPCIELFDEDAEQLAHALLRIVAIRRASLNGRLRIVEPESELVSNPYKLGCTEHEAFYAMAKDKRETRERFIGTLMLLAYDEIISNDRARELAGMDHVTWRTEMRRMTDGTKGETP
jgi:hypothetical protein